MDGFSVEQASQEGDDGFSEYIEENPMSPLSLSSPFLQSPVQSQQLKRKQEEKEKLEFHNQSIRKKLKPLIVPKMNILIMAVGTR